jgi:hypothetical protein
VDEDSVEHERHMKMENRKEYFNSLDDILEWRVQTMKLVESNL